MPEEIFPRPFEFPKNLKDMTETEKDRLRQNYLAHQGSMVEDEIQLNPSRLIINGDEVEDEIEEDAADLLEAEIENPEVRARVLPQFRFDPILGYIVNGEDPQALSSLDISEDERHRILQRMPRNVSDREVEIYRIASMGAVEREIEERFGDI